MQEFRVKCDVGVIPRKTTAVNPEPVLVPHLNGSMNLQVGAWMSRLDPNPKP